MKTVLLQGLLDNFLTNHLEFLDKSGFKLLFFIYFKNIDNVALLKKLIKIRNKYLEILVATEPYWRISSKFIVEEELLRNKNRLNLTIDSRLCQLSCKS